MDASSASCVWFQPVCDLATVGAALLLACLIGRIVPRRFTDRFTIIFWTLFLIALCLGGLLLIGLSLDMPVLCDFYGLVKVLTVVLLWSNAIVLWNLLPHQSSLAYFLDFDAELERQAAERVRTEEQLQQSENRFRTIFDNTRDVICCVDPYGRMLAVNGRVEEVFGYTPEELIGKRFTKLGILPLKDIPQIVRLFRQTILQGKATEIVVLELKHKNGKSVWAEVGTRFVRRNGRIAEIVNVFRDITERKRVMVELTAARQAAEAAQPKAAMSECACPASVCTAGQFAADAPTMPATA